MIVPNDFEERLGFDQIKIKLKGLCKGPLGEQLVQEMRFRTTKDEIILLLEQTKSILGLQDRGLELPLSSYDDPRSYLHTAAVDGSFLETHDFLKLARVLDIIHQANTFLRKQATIAPALAERCTEHSPGELLRRSIAKIIDEEGRVKDNASSDLSRIRRRLREEERKIRSVADHLMRQALENGWAPSGSQPTIRDGRLVIPVAAEHKRRMKGYVVDESSTGQTVYLEPGEVIEANNDLRDLELEERREIVRLLRELTSQVRIHHDELQSGFDFLGWLDFTHAKARLAKELDAGFPVVESAPVLEWRDARHPLLHLSFKGKRKLIPLTISLENDNRFLLVSGPNAGGKSVCLKTVGLIQYMLQCGLLVPMNEDSRVGIFRHIFLDIGDQQSLENDLSTYSSHLRNMNQFLRSSDEESLILLDELGAGTDPNFGGGIAQAVLDQLVRKRAWGVATTHYYNLKLFASHTDGIRNAAMQFDAEHLTPLFKLEIGQPGSSFALEIARNTGLPEKTIETAESIIGKDLAGLEKLMKQVAEDKVMLERKREEVEREQMELRKALEHYQSLSGEIESRKKDILNRARTEAADLLKETNREIEKTIRHIRENKAEKKETRKVREGLKELGEKVKPSSVSTPVIQQTPLKEGDKVRMRGGEVTGTILSLKGKAAVVQFGDLRSALKLDQLVRSDLIEAEPGARKVRGIELHQRQSDFSSVLDVRGMRVEEVQPVMQRFIDDAVLLGQHEVKIIHGKGEGVLRKVIRDYLRSRKEVESFRDEHADRGGEGITWVTFR